jgi:hypothetical protein
VFPHHTDFGLGVSVALLEENILGPAAVGGMTLRANIAAAVGVPAATQGFLCMCYLHHWGEVPFSACCILVGGMACTRCDHITQQAWHPVSWQLFLDL